MNRFSQNIRQDIIHHCTHHEQKIHKIIHEYPFIDYKSDDFIRLINLFIQISEKDYNINDSLVISIGESPSKMVFIQSHFKDFKIFYLPISKTLLHLDIKSFFQEMENVQEDDWEIFYQSHIDNTFLNSYLSFLRKRGILNDLLNKLKTCRNFIFVDFILYGNSFVGFLLHVFIPLLEKYEFFDKRFFAVFLIGPDNEHHRISDALAFLLKVYFYKYSIYYLSDYFSPKVSENIADFFMDNRIRTIQQVIAPNYKTPDYYPKKEKYMTLIVCIFMMIFLNADLRKKLLTPML